MDLVLDFDSLVSPPWSTLLEVVNFFLATPSFPIWNQADTSFRSCLSSTTRLLHQFLFQ